MGDTTKAMEKFDVHIYLHISRTHYAVSITANARPLLTLPTSVVEEYIEKGKLIELSEMIGRVIAFIVADELKRAGEK